MSGPRLPRGFEDKRLPDVAARFHFAEVYKAAHGSSPFEEQLPPNRTMEHFGYKGIVSLKGDRL